MTPTMAPPKKTKKSGDKAKRKPRRMIGFPPRLYDQLERLALKNNRPISWEARLLMEEILEQKGMWPPSE